MSGYEIAKKMLDDNNITDVKIVLPKKRLL